MRADLNEEMDICGGVTDSVFPVIERILNEKGEYRRALRYVASRKNMYRYISLMDFLFCEIYQEYQSACFKFYADRGPPLREMVTEANIKEYTRVLLKVLDIALEAYKAEVSMSWKGVYEELLRVY